MHRTHRELQRCVAGLVSLAMSACGRHRYQPADVQYLTDASIDASRTEDVPTDAWNDMDAIADAALDATLDVTPDATPDVTALDARFDAAMDSGPDSARDASFDAGSDTRAPDSGPGGGFVMRGSTPVGSTIRDLSVLADGTALVAGALGSGGSFVLGGRMLTATADSAYLASVDGRVAQVFAMTADGGFPTGPFAASADGLAVISGRTQAPLRTSCGSPPSDGPNSEAFIVAYRVSDGSCAWQAVSNGLGNEYAGKAVPWQASPGDWRLLLPVITDRDGAFGASFARGAVVSLRAVDGGLDRAWAVPFAPAAVAVEGTDLLVVGEEQVWCFDVRLATTAPPRWSHTFASPGAMSTDYAAVAVSGSEIFVGGSARTDAPTPAGFGGADDAWVIGLDRAGTVRWARLFGGVSYDYVTRLRARGGFLLVGGNGIGAITLGIDLPAIGGGYEAMLLELDRGTGVVDRAQRFTEPFAAGIEPQPTGTFLFAMTASVRELE